MNIVYAVKIVAKKTMFANKTSNDKVLIERAIMS